MSEISNNFQLRRIFMNGTIIFNVNIKNLNTNETIIPNLIDKISHAKEVINFNHIFLTKDLENGFMVISIEGSTFYMVIIVIIII